MFSSAIGYFIIGSSPVGYTIPFDFEETILSQYANSPTLIQLISNINGYIDPTANFDSFFNLVWNVNTAQGWGLDVWGRIVGVSRILAIAAGTYMGTTGPPGHSGDSLNVAPLYSGQPTTNNFALSDDAFRTLILAKALSNICNCSTPAINQILLNLFPNQGNCYVTDGQDMTMTYTFTLALDPVSAAIVSQSGVLPKPAGVSATVVSP